MIYVLCLGLLFSSSCLFSSDNPTSSYNKIQKDGYRSSHHSTFCARPSFHTKKDRSSDDNEPRSPQAVECAQTSKIHESTVAALATVKKEAAQDRQDQASRSHTIVKKEQKGFIYDAFTQRRGAPNIIRIFCKVCDTRIMDYQKDGPGRLLRCYGDRCIDCPLSEQDRHFTSRTVNSAPRLKCPDCTTSIGYPMIYRGHGENRPAFHLKPNAFYIKN